MWGAKVKLKGQGHRERKCKNRLSRIIFVKNGSIYIQTKTKTRKLCYRKDDREMRAI